ASGADQTPSPGKHSQPGTGNAPYATTTRKHAKPATPTTANSASPGKPPTAEPPTTHTTTTRIKNMIEFTFEQVETVAEARWELEIMRYPEHAQHMIRTWQKLGDQGKSEIRQEAQY